MLPTSSLTSVPLSQVTLLDPYLVNATEKTRGYLDRLDPARFLYSFYLEAGLEPLTTSGYGGWERTTGLRFQGHFFGHYLSAVAQAYGASGDGALRDVQLGNLTVAVDGLETCQRAYAAAHPFDTGYLAPFPVDFLPSGSDGLLVPFYNLHKVLAGLLHVHHYLPSQLGDRALTVAAEFGSWIGRWADRQPDPAVILATEYGGMNDALYELYALTRDPAHKRAAEHFDELELFHALADGRDVLNGLHANTTIPKLVGALKRYLVHVSDEGLYAALTDAEKAELPRYRRAAERFWQIVIDGHTYANGANSQSEHFHEAGSLCRHATNGATTGYGENSTAEGCNEYNMLKLTRLLFELTGHPRYADYYESTFINSILASQNPETGMVTYFQPMAPGYAKVFGRELDEFWCDHGTGIESFTKLGDSIYFSDAASVYVTMFRSSIARVPHLNLCVSQVADVPSADEVTLTITSLDGDDFDGDRTLHLRVPAWIAGPPELTLNGSPVAVAPVDGFLTVPVAAGDEVRYRLPATLVLDDSTENPNFVAVKFGPVLLARALSRERVDADYEAGVLVRMGVADKSLSADLPVSSVEDWKDQLTQNLVRVPGRPGTGGSSLRFDLRGERPWSFEPYFSLYDARYAIYTTLIEPDSVDAQALIRATKEQQRSREVTLDSLTSFDNNNSEADKNYASSDSTVGTFDGRTFRQAAPNGWFSYQFALRSRPDTLWIGVLFHARDADRTFEVVVDETVVASEPLNPAGVDGGGWFTKWYQVPRDDSRGTGARDPALTLRFQGVGTSRVPAVHGIDVRSHRDFDDDPRLAGLEVSVGELRPAFSPDQRMYTLSVPHGTSSLEIRAIPQVASGLITIDGVLVDDSSWRPLPLDGAERTVLVASFAQDHSTQTTVEITVARSTRPARQPGADAT